MAKTIAASGRYPYGINGFVIQGAVLNDGTIIKDARIRKQRNSYDFDVNLNDGSIYSSLRITGVDKHGTALNYNSTDDVLAAQLKPGHFYVRAMNEKGEHGFAIKFFDNKVILSDGRYLFNLIPPSKAPLGTISFQRVMENDTVINGTIIPYSSQDINTNGMLASVIIDGEEYTSEVQQDGSFSIIVPALKSGTYVVTILTDFYESPSALLNVNGDDDNVISFFIPQSNFIKQSDDTYSAVLLGSVHNESDFIIQTQNSTGQVYTQSVTYNDVTHDITFNQITPADTNALLLTNDIFVKTVSTSDWTQNNAHYTITVPKSEHNKLENIVVQVSEELSLHNYQITNQSISIDSSSNITINVINPFNARILISGT